MNEYSSTSQPSPYPYAPAAQSSGREFTPASDTRKDLDDQREMGFALLSAKLVGMRMALQDATTHITGEDWHDDEDESVEYGLSPLCLPHYRNKLGESIDGEPGSAAPPLSS